jgi:glyoxylase-like metal-dependent hydrolase (beta-lactamase superfamily II)
MIQYRFEEVHPWLYRIHDPLDVNFYLLVGDERALLFDTGHGIGDIRGAVSAVTDKPLTVVLGHGHIDHANGAYQFEEVYLHEGDFDLSRRHCSPEMRDMIVKQMEGKGLKPDFDPVEWRGGGGGNLVKLEIGTVFDLGGLRAEVIDMAGHTAGSIGLLVPDKRALLDSDSANEHCWMFLEESLPMRHYISMLERVHELEFDVFYTAHSDAPHPRSDFLRYINAARNASVEKSHPYNMFAEMKPYIYTEDGVSVVFNERTLKG